MRAIEKLILLAENPPFSMIYRMVYGFFLVPAYQGLVGNNTALWSFLMFFGCALLLLRIVPAVMRRVVHFSPEVQELWSKRRQWAKSFDSYQWRKLFWIGSGLAIHALLYGNIRSTFGYVAMGCLAGGGIGLLLWRRLGLDRRENPL